MCCKKGFYCLGQMFRLDMNLSEYLEIWRHSMNKTIQRHVLTARVKAGSWWMLIVTVNIVNEQCVWCYPLGLYRTIFSAGNVRKIRPSGFTKYKDGWVKEGKDGKLRQINFLVVWILFLKLLLHCIFSQRN